MIVKFIRKLCLWYVVILPVSLQMTCLPDSSKEIDKAREKDNRANKKIELRQKRNDKINKAAYGLNSTKNKIQVLAGNPPSITAFNKDELTKICREFFEQTYIPYLNAAQEYCAHNAKYETQNLKKQRYSGKLNWIKGRLAKVQALLKAGNTKELCEFILKIK
jgi:hypothetical protein